MRIARILSAVGLVVALAFTAAAAQNPIPSGVKTPLPATLKIETADSSLPPDAAIFSGIWVGQWNTNPPRDATVVVHKVRPGGSGGRYRADFIYSWGAFGTGAYEGQRPGFIEVDGQIRNGELSGQYSRVSLRFRRNDDGSLAGTWQTNFGHFQATFVRATD